MNKTLLSSLGISFLFLAGSLVAMDADTFSYLISLYNEKEITRQQLINAYNAFGSKNELQAALKAEGISFAALKEEAQTEQEQFTQTFEALIYLYKDAEITRSQLIKAYELFETEDSRAIGDQLLQVSLSKSIAQLKQEEARQRTQQLRNSQRNSLKSGLKQPPVKPSAAVKNLYTPQKGHHGRKNDVQEHLNMVWARKRARQIEQFLRNREEKEKMLSAKNSSSGNKGSLSTPKPAQKDLSSSPSPATINVQNSSTDSLESLTDLLDQSKAQQAGQEKLLQQLNPQEIEDTSSDIEEDSENEDNSSENADYEEISTDEDRVKAPRAARLTSTSNAGIPAKKKVRFTLPSENIHSQEERIEKLRRHGQAQFRPTQQETEVVGTEELSVHLTSKGTPVFTKGGTLLNPLIEGAQFNTSIAPIKEETLHAWGLKLATLATTDSKREKALKPLIHAFKQPKAPQAKLSLLIQPTAIRFSDRDKLETLINAA